MRAPAGVAVAAAVAAGYVGAVDPNEAGNYPTCPVLATTGLFCPGCGSLRAVHALTQGDVAAAVELNVLAVLGLMLLAAIWWAWARRSWSGRPRTSVASPTLLWMLLGGVALFTVLRNLSVGAVLAP